MKNRIALILISALLLMTALTAAYHLNTRTETEPGALTVVHSGRTIALPIADMALSDIRGEVVNGKGETRAIDARGISLADILTAAGIEAFDQITIVASDEYRAELSPGDLLNANLIVQDDGGLQLIIFGDPNSKRNVSDAVRMEVQ